MHCNEQEIQQIVLGETECPQEAVNHFHSCYECQETAAHYEQMFSKIIDIEQERFDFDLTEVVMSDIRKLEKDSTFDRYFIAFAALFSLLFFTVSIIFFGSYLTRLFSGFSVISIGMMATTLIYIMIFQWVDGFRKYNKQSIAMDFF